MPKRKKKIAVRNTDNRGLGYYVANPGAAISEVKRRFAEASDKTNAKSGPMSAFAAAGALRKRKKKLDDTINSM